MTERFPDLEIYLLKPAADAITRWLTEIFPDLDTLSTNNERSHWRAGGMDIYLNDKAEKNFASLWFKKNDTPWANDLELGRAAYQALQCEVRCSDSGWQEDEGAASNDGWIKINQNGEKPFQW